MPGKINKKDMLALAELIREKGFDVRETREWADFSFVATKGADTILIGQHRGRFVASERIKGFPMSPYGEGGIRFQIVI